ncbi:hypothetical protein EJ05DRAFT_479564 [Pseudovirgaria hyperparasitica]|uniref:DASH complex subunit DAD1 n=1 Tax=Pseudovirgaria hyperparasitica TaxID=470096 RepID=A0A6A6VWG5_9PEZI|nr:uncharacterized protein EJ05DRAFT_479564 [Pseudovirgaria hyperparasitica]KAF2754593.1 hypothetical protein EJ05DRAFT_479564 [Pseudovirgaria hyperparasitica]
MSHQHTASTSAPSDQRTYFEQQRDELVGEVAQSLEHVLANMNKLNRNLEQLIAVGTEFSSVEALWSQFENVMHKDPEEAARQQQQQDSGSEEETEITVGTEEK